MAQLIEVEDDSALDIEFVVAQSSYPDTFFITGTCIYPNLFISELSNDPLPIPLDASIVSKLKSIAISSSFGVGMETKYDKNVRNSYELNSSQFKLTDFNLSSTESSILENIRQTLLPQCTYIIAEPYKLLIYEQGCFFNIHHDTMKSQNHFGSLILSIPYIDNYEGGIFILYFDSDYDSDCSTQSDIINKWKGDGNFEWISNAKNDDIHDDGKCKYIAFYSDTNHEIKEVTNGVRITITFNLFYPNNVSDHFNFQFIAPHCDETYDAIEQVTSFPNDVILTIIHFCGDCNHEFIQEINNVLSESKALCIISSHRYGGKHSDPMMLKGRDIFWYRWLIQYFMVIITPILIRNIGETDKYDKCSNYDRCSIIFGKTYKDNRWQSVQHGDVDIEVYPEYVDKNLKDHIEYNEDVDTQIGRLSYNDKVYVLYNDDKDDILAKPWEKDHLCWWSGNYGLTAKELQYQCFGLLVTKKREDKDDIEYIE